MPNSVRSKTVIMPTRPRVEMKAKASGTPAKLEATPQKVVMNPCTKRGSPPRVMP
jgi:hypothetical protein